MNANKTQPTPSNENPKGMSTMTATQATPVPDFAEKQMWTKEERKALAEHMHTLAGYMFHSIPRAYPGQPVIAIYVAEDQGIDTTGLGFGEADGKPKYAVVCETHSNLTAVNQWGHGGGSYEFTGQWLTSHPEAFCPECAKNLERYQQVQGHGTLPDGTEWTLTAA